MKIEQIDKKTGEVKEKKIVFRTQYYNPDTSYGLDYSNPFEDTYTEIPPFTRDANGKWLNDTSVPKLVSNGRVNIQEKIQSFADEVDIYKILEKFALSDDPSYINKDKVAYADISNIPTNINDYQAYVSNLVNDASQFSPDFKNKLYNNTLTETDIETETKRLFDLKYPTKKINKENKENIEKVEKEKKNE